MQGKTTTVMTAAVMMTETLTASQHPPECTKFSIQLIKDVYKVILHKKTKFFWC